MATGIKTTNLAHYYEQIKSDAHLRTVHHAQRWSDATLKTLGLHLDRRTKKALSNVLPEELAEPLNRVFWLLHFRESQLPALAFQKQVARRVGATDEQFAREPIVAVFQNLKGLIEGDLSAQVAKALSPEVRQLWEQA